MSPEKPTKARSRSGWWPAVSALVLSLAISAAAYHSGRDFITILVVMLAINLAVLIIGFRIFRS